MKIKFDYLLLVALLMTVLTLLISGCSARPDLGIGSSQSGNNVTPLELEAAPHPITVRAANEGGIILSDQRGNLYTYGRDEWISSIVAKQGLKPGDILCP
jgi:hypothetical protein